MQNIKRSFSRFNWPLYSALLFTGLLPTIYTTIRINYLGDLPGDWGVNIASQLVWVNLILEVVYEALILPLFYLIGKTINDKAQTVNKIKSGLVVTFFIYLGCTLIITIFAKQLVTSMAQNPDTIDATTSYIRFEMGAAIIFSLVKFMMVVFILLMLILLKFAWGPITQGLEKREQGIADKIDQARLDAEQAAETLGQYKQQLQDAVREAQQIVAQAR